MRNEERMIDLRGWIEKIKSGKSTKIAVILGVAGVLLILCSEWFPNNKTDDTLSVAVSAESYCAAVEERLHALLRKMEGVGDCHVYVTLENGVEYVYAKQQQENADRSEDKGDNGEQKKESADIRESVILINGEDGEEGLLLTEIQPQVKGVVVVCDGGKNQAVKERITAVVTTALNISARRVCVTT